jgi:hypothetical protein
MAPSKKNPTLLADAMAFAEQQLATRQFPRLTSCERERPLQDQFASGKKARPHRTAVLAAQFERGLNAILDGLVLSMNLL